MRFSRENRARMPGAISNGEEIGRAEEKDPEEERQTSHPPYMKGTCIPLARSHERFVTRASVHSER